MKLTAAERLSNEFYLLTNRIYEYSHKIKKSNIRWGICLATPKYSTFQGLSKTLQMRLVDKAKEHFIPLGIDAIYFQYHTPPILPTKADKDINSPLVIDDYQLTFEVCSFDNEWDQKLLAKNLIYCPSEDELGWYNEWFTPQENAIRLTPLLHKNIEDYKKEREIRNSFSDLVSPVFDSFIKNYILEDINIGISKEERQSYFIGTSDWKALYPSLLKLISLDGKNVLYAYKEALKKAKETRNPKNKSLLLSFVNYIEQEFVLKRAYQPSKSSYLLRL